MTTVIVGASAGLGRALATEAARRGHSLLLLSSDSRDLEATASDLRIRFGAQVRCRQFDARSRFDLSDTFAAEKDHGGITSLLLPIGFSTHADTVIRDARSSREILDVNFLAVADCIAAAIPCLSPRGSTVVGFGSVASVRGRARNASYAAAKRALQSYFESLRFHMQNEPARVQFYIVGFLDTNLAWGAATPLPRADADRFAKTVLRRLHSHRFLMYYPSYWRIIAAALRATPWPVYRRLPL